MKVCSKCGQEKPLDKYYVDNSSKDGRTYTCKKCIDLHKKSDKYKVSRKAEPKRKKLARKNEDLKRKYNLSLEDWNKMWENQQGLCGWCGKKMMKSSGRFNKYLAVVDHNHKPPYEVRMLCHSYCNMNDLVPYENDFTAAVLRPFNYPFPKEEKLAAYKKLKELYDGIS